jgi:hypothetical protein
MERGRRSTANSCTGWTSPTGRTRTVIINVAQPKAVATDELRMDRNLAIKDWVKMFNLGIIGIVCIDAYLFFQQVVHGETRTTSCLDFCRLTDKLTKNQEGVRRGELPS